jgi:hypothetical protein
MIEDPKTLFFKENPEYLGCYWADPPTIWINWELAQGEEPDRWIRYGVTAYIHELVHMFAHLWRYMRTRKNERDALEVYKEELAAYRIQDIAAKVLRMASRFDEEKSATLSLAHHISRHKHDAGISGAVSLLPELANSTK